MAKRSAFRDFIKALKQDWRSNFPAVRPLEVRLDEMLPKASTFYAGQMQPAGMHVFLNFQHSAKAWEVGEFTINIVLSRRMGMPERWAGPMVPRMPDPGEGSYRIGPFVGPGDKWWHLLPEQTSSMCQGWGIDMTPLPRPLDWQPPRFDDDAVVIREAVADVNQDVGAALRKLGLA